MTIDKNKIFFETENYDNYNKLKFELKRKDIHQTLRKIRVSSEPVVQYENSRNCTDANLALNKLTLKSKVECFFKIWDMNHNGLLVFGSLNQNVPNSSFVFTKFLDSNSLLEIEYWSSDLHIHKKASNLRFPSNAPIELDECP